MGLCLGHLIQTMMQSDGEENIFRNTGIVYYVKVDCSTYT